MAQSGAVALVFCVVFVATGWAVEAPDYGDSAVLQDLTSDISGESFPGAMHIVDGENVTVYGIDWVWIADGVMEKRTESSIIRHVYGENGLNWKLQDFSEQIEALRALPDADTQQRLRLAELEVEYDSLRTAATKGINPIRIYCSVWSNHDFELWVWAGPYFNPLSETHWVRSIARSYNYSEVCAALLSTYISVQTTTYNQYENSWQDYGTDIGDHSAVLYPSPNEGPPLCYEAEAIAVYDPPGPGYFEAYEFGISNPACW